MDGNSGAFYWAFVDGSQPVLNAHGDTIWDTEAFPVPSDAVSEAILSVYTSTPTPKTL